MQITEKAILIKEINEAIFGKEEVKLSYLKDKLIPITERIKSLKDVFDFLGKRQPVLEDFNFIEDEKERKSTLAFHLIQNISKVLNEGWVPDFNNPNEYKYYLWFKREHGLAGSGGVWSVNVDGYLSDYTDLGFGCHFKTKDLALHAGKHFLDVFIDYLPE